MSLQRHCQKSTLPERYRPAAAHCAGVPATPDCMARRPRLAIQAVTDRLPPPSPAPAASAMSQLLGFYAQQLPSKLPAQYDLTQEASLDQAALDLGLAISSDVSTALAAGAAACAAAGSPGPAGLSPSPSPSPQPVPSPGWSPSPSDGGLGDSGGAVLPALEAARHDAFMQIIG